MTRTRATSSSWSRRRRTGTWKDGNSVSSSSTSTACRGEQSKHLFGPRIPKFREMVLIIVGLDRDSFVNEILPHIDCVVLGPGPGTPHRDSDFSWPTRLIAEFGDRLPIFGLCLGLQGLATTFGGKVRLGSATKGAEQAPTNMKRAEFIPPAGHQGRGAKAWPDQPDPPRQNVNESFGPLRRRPGRI